jgi:y4mF family transcriptional regulator
MKSKSRRSAGSASPAWATELGATVRKTRKLLRLTQKELADLAGCGPDFLYDLERGKTTVRLDKLVPVLEMLGLTFKVEPRVHEVSRDDK